MALNTKHKGLAARLNFSPEERLLIICARSRLTGPQRNDLNRLLTGNLRWDQVLRISHWHRLSALMYLHLRAPDCRERVPVGVMDQLKAMYLANVARNHYYQSELQNALEALRDGDIPVILLKGAALAGTVYLDIGLRPMSDLDLLVRREDADAAEAIIQGLGYSPQGREEDRESKRSEDRELARLVSNTKPVVIELHSHIVEMDSPLRFDITSFWRRALESNFGSSKALTLGPEDLLIHLAINFLRDRRRDSYAALGQLCDIAQATRSFGDKIDWARFTQEVAQSSVRRPVFFGLYIAQEMLEAYIPVPVMRLLEPANFDAKDVERLVRRRVLGDKWVAKALVSHRLPFNWRTLVIAATRKLIPPKQDLSVLYNVPGQSNRVYLLYFQRLPRILAVGARLIARTRETLDDIAVDRVLHSLDLYQDKGANVDLP